MDICVESLIERLPYSSRNIDRRDGKRDRDRLGRETVREKGEKEKQRTVEERKKEEEEEEEEKDVDEEGEKEEQSGVGETRRLGPLPRRYTALRYSRVERKVTLFRIKGD
ncbi:hypothetical protein V1477_003724 [Vespula maculifrons]|uniref:Uncharacterized protein n=1 Tax=Vespula maculifrons TaxID=7453 RepID=A0ABD2CSS9_VESMC